MTLDQIIAEMRKRLSQSSFRHTALFDFDEDGQIFLDGTAEPPLVEAATREAEVTLVTSIETFAKILAGTQDPNFAFMTGKLKIRGSLGLALKLNAMLEG
jgi:putative sterol carrier protein